MNDATILARDIAGDAATKAANKVNPSDEQLSQMDRAADDNTWHDAPNMSAGNIKQQLKSTVNKKTPLDKDDLRDAAGNASQNAHPDGSRDPTDVANIAAQDQQQGSKYFQIPKSRSIVISGFLTLQNVNQFLESVSTMESRLIQVFCSKFWRRCSIWCSSWSFYTQGSCQSKHPR